MYSLLGAFKRTQSTSLRGLQSALSSSRGSAVELLQTLLIHEHYVKHGGRPGVFGWPTGEVTFSGGSATRSYRGGKIRILAGESAARGGGDRAKRVIYLGFECKAESSWDQSSATDEPYFIISLDTGNGDPKTKTFKYEKVETGTKFGEGAFLSMEGPPDPMAIKVLAFERDYGDPDATAAAIQKKLVEASNQLSQLASAAETADGPGYAAPVAATAGGLFAGPIGGAAVGLMVAAMDLGDDYIGQNVATAWIHPGDPMTPPKLGEFDGKPYNIKISINGGGEGHYELFFDVSVVFKPDPEPIP